MKLQMDGGGEIEGEYVQSDGGGLHFIEGHGVPRDQQKRKEIMTDEALANEGQESIRKETEERIKIWSTKAPSVGDMVLYVLSDLDGTAPYKGEVRPAIITRVWDNPVRKDSVVQLQVFTDGQNDGMANVEWRTSVHQDHKKSPGTFHYVILT